MIKDIDTAARDAALQVADLMLLAAKTAPKASGQNKVVGMCLTGDDKKRLSQEMAKLGEEFDEEFITRDAGNVDSSICVVILGVEGEPFGLDNCHMCGFENCGQMASAGANCALNITDLGIAVGSAVSVAADHRVDNRVMYSVGRAAVSAGFFPSNVRVAFGIPLYAGSKSIFFDRGPGAVLR